MAAARRTGVGVAFARGSNHFGPINRRTRSGHAVKASPVIIASNATTTIAPAGWTRAPFVLGQQPAGDSGVPVPGGDPVMLDIAMSVAARAQDPRCGKERGADSGHGHNHAAGLPTTNPNAALDGFLQPIGGHKGSGLSIMIDLFTGLLSGAAYLTHVQSWNKTPDRPAEPRPHVHPDRHRPPRFPGRTGRPDSASSRTSFTTHHPLIRPSGTPARRGRDG